MSHDNQASFVEIHRVIIVTFKQSLVSIWLQITTRDQSSTWFLNDILNRSNESRKLTRVRSMSSSGTQRTWSWLMTSSFSCVEVPNPTCAWLTSLPFLHLFFLSVLAFSWFLEDSTKKAPYGVPRSVRFSSCTVKLRFFHVNVSITASASLKHADCKQGLLPEFNRVVCEVVLHTQGNVIRYRSIQTLLELWRQESFQRQMHLPFLIFHNLRLGWTSEYLGDLEIRLRTCRSDFKGRGVERTHPNKIYLLVILSESELLGTCV